MPIDGDHISPLNISEGYLADSFIMSPISPSSPKMAKRQVLQQQCPARFSTIEKLFNTDTNRGYHVNKMKNIIKDFEGNNRHTRLIEDKNAELPLSQKSNKSLKFLRRNLIINSDGGISKRITSSETLQYMLHGVDKLPNDISSPYDNGEEDNVSYSDGSRNSVDHLTIEQPIRILTAPYNYATNKYSQEHMIPSSCTDNREYMEEQNNMIRQENSSSYITNKKINEDDETELDLSSSFSSPILMNDKEPYRKIWVPYFTGLTTLIIFVYFIISIVYNAMLTGHVIQVSPFNQMIGPAPETLIYLGGRYIPCIKRSRVYPTTESKFPCPYSIVDTLIVETPINSTKQVNFLSIDPDKQPIDSCYLHVLCGGKPFKNADTPDQKYRFVSAIFIHSGVIQLLINIVAHIFLGCMVERRINPFRYCTIWFGSGIFGYIFGAIFVPEANVSVGCSVSLMGVIAFLVIDLILNWNYSNRPYAIMSKLIACFVFTLIIGYLPGYDNFSHIGGFLAGLLITLAVMPLAKAEDISLNYSCDTRIESYVQTIQFWMMRAMAVIFIIILLWILLHIFSASADQLVCKTRLY
ncbi:hypothetical protein BDF21DRAFT_376748 [Thamnidium elegans]|nr:hypothetical protein BDF21DRAFT_376748 [Thamnidium elegans]